MRHLLGVVMALLLVGSSSMIATAQDATPDIESTATGEPTVFSEGLDAPATYFSERGDPLATITVTDIQRGWDEYGRFYEPTVGAEYVAVTIEVENLSRGNMIVRPRDFRAVDSYGLNLTYSRANVDDDSNAVIFREDTAIASSETIEVTIIFEVYEAAEIYVLVWQPDRNITVMVDLRNA